ncbi:MAG: insulinase family protein [Gracilimonas sp.]|uniref:M16 family metallopeptidase n=1 Tax=Gracilimonas TaxID=649462 RepID=UPI001B223D5F|nr:pitrilysin family protein [Gracilimonas sp.]MBO6585714.1 insulinase family protein [Gracilimonas sp.]MBO6616711.1 insulinase family protein [Gracilimonas sp.]
MKRLSLLCLALALTSSALFAQKKYDEIKYPELNSFQVPEVETYTADNGITYYLLEDTELPLIEIRVNIKTGGVLVSAEKEGLASITGTVIRSGGTQSIPADSLNVLLENKAASMETGIGFTSGSAWMNVLAEDFDELLPIFIDLLTNPAFPDDKIELAKTQTKSSISRRNDNSQSVGVREFQKLIYGPESVYARTTEYETIDNITREDIVNFHKDHFVSENMMIGVVGDFDASEMKQKLEEAFSNIPSGEETSLDFPEVDYEPQSTINFAHKSDVNQSFILMGHLGGMRDNPDYPQIQVMNRVLSGGFSGRLMQVIRTEMGLAYSAFGQYSMNSFYPGFFFAGVSTKSSTTAEAIEAVIEQIRRLQNEPITKKELQDTKDQILNSSVFEYDSYEEVLSQQMSYDYRGLPGDAFDQYIEGVKNTTIEDVQRVAKEYLNPDYLQIMVVGNKDEIGDQLQQFGDVNEVDITIPEPGSDEPVVDGDATKGKEWLEKMANALVEPGSDVVSIQEKSVITQKTPMGDMDIQNSSVTNFADYSTERNLTTPQGQMTMSFKDGSGTMQMGGQQRQLPPQMAKPMLNEMKRNYLSIAINHEDIQAEYLGDETVDGEDYAVVRMTNDQVKVTYLLDQETGLPHMSRYTEMNPQTGQRQEAKSVYSDWNEAGGVMYAYSVVTYVDEQVAAELTVESHSIPE